MLDALPMACVCHHVFVSCMFCLVNPSRHFCCIVLFLSSCKFWQSIQEYHTENSFRLLFVLEVTLCCLSHWASLSLLSLCSTTKDVLQQFPHQCKVRFRVDCLTKHFYLIGRQMKNRELKSLSESAFTAS